MESNGKIIPFPERKQVGWFCFAPMDLTFLCLVAVLSCVGLLMLFSASYPYAYYVKGDALFYVVRQGKHLLLGLTAMMVVSCCDYRRLKRYGRGLLWGSIVLLVIVLVPRIGVVRNNAQRWISVLAVMTMTQLVETAVNSGQGLALTAEACEAIVIRSQGRCGIKQTASE